MVYIESRLLFKYRVWLENEMDLNISCSKNATITNMSYNEPSGKINMGLSK